MGSMMIVLLPPAGMGSNDTGRRRAKTIIDALGAKWLPALGASKNRRKRKRNDTELTTQRSIDYRPAVHELSPGTAGKSKNRRLPPAVHAIKKRGKEK